MEILKFSEPPQRSSRSASARKSGLMPMVTFGIAVLVLGGMSTTLAGTISLGSGGSVEFGQGVVTTAACDTTIDVIPVSDFETSTADGFFVKSIILRNIGISGGLNETSTAESRERGCLNKVFTIRGFSATGELNFTDMAGANGVNRLAFRIPSGIETATSGTNYTDKPFAEFATYAVAGAFTALSSTTGGTAAGNGEITISNFRLPKSLERLTLESSS